LQTDLRHSALETGFLILPMTAPMTAMSPLGGRLMRFGLRPIMTVGMALGTAGLVVLAQVDTSSGYGLLFPGYLLFGISFGCVYAPISTAAMTAMPQAKASIAAGVLGMNRVLAGAITLSAGGAVFQAVLDNDRHAGRAEPAAFASALSSSMWLLVGLSAVGTVLTWAFVRASDDGASPPSIRRMATSTCPGSAGSARDHQRQRPTEASVRRRATRRGAARRRRRGQQCSDRGGGCPGRPAASARRRSSHGVTKQPDDVRRRRSPLSPSRGGVASTPC
jgi:MFS family permease